MRRSFAGGGRENAPAFDAAAGGGPVGTLELGFQGEARLIGRVDGGRELAFAATNGRIAAPAGRLQIQRFVARARDSKERGWTAQAGLYGRTNVEVKADAATPLALGPPFRAAVKITWSGTSEQIQLSPSYVDRSGAEFQVCADARLDPPPGFVFLDPAGEVVWRGSFEYG